MLHLLQRLGQQGAQALQTHYGAHPKIPTVLPISATTKPEHGDLQISICLALAKPLGTPPRELALVVQGALQGDPSLDSVEIAGPGYVNLFLDNRWLAEQLQSLLRNQSFGVDFRHHQETVVLDFSSPNIAKPMHIGHIRSTILGDSLQRVFRMLGYRVISDNHLGDWGTQFGKLIVAYRLWLDPIAYQKSPIQELVRLYQLFVMEEKKQGDRTHASTAQTDEDGGDEEGEESQATPLLQAARVELRKLQQGDPENQKLWQEFVRISMETFQKSYERLGVAFDVQHGESFYHPFLAPLVERLLQNGIAQKSQGAIICLLENLSAPLVIQKQDGAFLYGTSDLACIEYRVSHWNPQRILYVVGEPQKLHFQQVFSVARQMGVTCALEHISFGSIRFRDSETGKWTMGSTRKGNVPLLDNLLDESVERALHIVREKNPSLDPEEQARIAAMVGLGAIKYNNLNRDRQADIHFDWEQALSLNGNTAPYIQYAYARLRAILRKALEEGPFPEPEQLRLVHTTEHRLAVLLLDFGGTLERVAHTTQLHLLTEYLYQLSVQVNQLYQELPVLKAEPAERNARLLLLEQTSNTLHKGLELLGIDAPERM